MTGSNLVENGKNPQKYIRYRPEAVDQYLGQFFEGQQWAEQKR
jgi:exocyst complex component 7